MLGWLKRRADKKAKRQEAFAFGQKTAAQLIDAVNTFLDRRLTEVSENFLQAFDGRLKTIHDESAHPPRSVAQVEFQIFREHLADFKTKLRQDVDIQLKQWLDLAAEMGGIDQINTYIDQRIADAQLAVLMKSIEMFAEVVGELPEDQPTS